MNGTDRKRWLSKITRDFYKIINNRDGLNCESDINAKSVVPGYEGCTPEKLVNDIKDLFANIEKFIYSISEPEDFNELWAVLNSIILSANMNGISKSREYNIYYDELYTFCNNFLEITTPLYGCGRGGCSLSIFSLRSRFKREEFMFDPKGVITESMKGLRRLRADNVLTNSNYEDVVRIDDDEYLF